MAGGAGPLVELPRVFVGGAAAGVGFAGAEVVVAGLLEDAPKRLPPAAGAEAPEVAVEDEAGAADEADDGAAAPKRLPAGAAAEEVAGAEEAGASLFWPRPPKRGLPEAGFAGSSFLAPKRPPDGAGVEPAAGADVAPKVKAGFGVSPVLAPAPNRDLAPAGGAAGAGAGALPKRGGFGG